MSTLRITHETIYQYNRPVRFGPHRLVLRPREGHDLQVERMTLTITPDFLIEWSRDVFGNSIAVVEFTAEAQELRFINQVDIRRGEMPRLAERGPVQVPYPITYDEIEAPLAAAYLVPIYPQERDAISAWAKTTIAPTDQTNAFAIITTLNEAIKKQIRYNRRDERGVQTPIETLEKSTGSCRDKATLLMEACRALGIAARFASGYLDCAASTAGTASTHAWAEAYLAGRGWTGFDSTLGEETSAKHIPIGLSNHPRGVMPITGRYFGAAADYIGLQVAVKFEANRPLTTAAAASQPLHPTPSSTPTAP